MKLTIVVISYNEVKTIAQAIDAVRSLDLDKEIIVIDNCSTDGTAEVLRALDHDDIKVVHQAQNYGVGKSYETGIRLARGDYVFIQHADLEYDHTVVLRMLELAEEEDLDAVFGSRLSGQLRARSRWSLVQEKPAYLASYISTYLVNRWYGYSFTDVIGAEFYRTSAIRKVPIDTYFSGFKFEHVSRMCKMGMRIGEVPVGYKPRANPADKKIRSYNMVNALWTMVKVRYFS